jgi:hypothetical protein
MRDDGQAGHGRRHGSAARGAGDLGRVVLESVKHALGNLSNTEVVKPVAVSIVDTERAGVGGRGFHSTGARGPCNPVSPTRVERDGIVGRSPHAAALTYGVKLPMRRIGG